MNTYSIADIEKFCEMMYSRPVDDFYIVPYGYPISFTAVPPLGQANQVVNLSANGDFIALGLCHYYPTEGASVTILTKQAPNARLLLTDASSGDPFTQNAAQLENWSTNGTALVNFAFPRFLQGRGAINAQLISLEEEADLDIELYLHGVLVRAWSAAPRSSQV